ncbi:MAG: FAD:protein transferase [Patescibacteria group bacterium]|jgi:thiamine biosynthesis lipoprotein|nr:FAD:protein transferase [Patescibacteria group bacterium]
MLKEYEFQDKVMGTDFIISLITDNESLALSGFNQALGIARAYESRFSRFLKNSELSILNKEKDLVVSDTFLKIFSVAENLYKETKRIFNPLLQVETVGYVSDFSSMEKDIKKIKDISYDSNWENISVDKDSKKVRLASNQKLDFGGFLKGYVAEDIVNILKYDFAGIIVNIGGDIFTCGNDENGKAFNFSVFNPISKRESENILVNNEAIATSGTYKRKWLVDNKEVFHILDSEKLTNPTTDLVSATVIAPHGYLAEAYATVSICLGLQNATKILDEKRFRYVLINTDGLVFKNT